MKIAIAVLTWNRLPALQQILKGLGEHCASHKIAVFEDAGIKDGTVDAMLFCAQKPVVPRPDLLAYQTTVSGGVEFFAGSENLGVSGNTNRVLKWFMDESGCDYLCICNDDLVIKGDFAAFYASAWEKLKIGLLCFCGFTSKAYAWDPDHVGGFVVKKLGRMTGAMMAMPRELVERIGYFDTRFGKFGEEHVDFTNRARHAGYQDLRGKPQGCLDIKNDLLAHLEVQSTMTGNEKAQADAAASQGSGTIDYAADGLYRPFKLRQKVRVAGVDGDGIAGEALFGYFNIESQLQVQ
jgi:GT2 family glycosyltransferase